MTTHNPDEFCRWCRGRGSVLEEADYASDGMVRRACTDCNGTGWRGSSITHKQERKVMAHVITDDFEMKVGGRAVSYGEVRYTIKLTQGRPARTWQNASDGNYHPAEGPNVEIQSVEYRIGNSEAWVKADHNLMDFDVTDAWLIARVEESLVWEAAE